MPKFPIKAELLLSQFQHLRTMFKADFYCTEHIHVQRHQFISRKNLTLPENEWTASFHLYDISEMLSTYSCLLTFLCHLEIHQCSLIRWWLIIVRYWMYKAKAHNERACSRKICVRACVVVAVVAFVWMCACLCIRVRALLRVWVTVWMYVHACVYVLSIYFLYINLYQKMYRMYVLGTR